MKFNGIGLAVVGALLYLFATFVFDTSVASTATGTGVFQMPERITNMGLQQQQLLYALAGLAMFIAGVIVTSLDVIAEILLRERSAAPIMQSEPTATSTVSRPDGMTDERYAQMLSAGIEHEGGKYWLGGNRYESLSDALAVSKFRAP